MRLVPDWRQAWRWFSVQISALGALASLGWVAVPADLKSTFPDWTQGAIAALIFFGVILGRLVDQNDG